MSATEESNSIHEFSPDPYAGVNTGELHINDLGDLLTQVLNIPSNNDKDGKAIKGDDLMGSLDDQSTSFTHGKCLSKRATFPCSRNDLGVSCADILNANKGLKDELCAEKMTLSGYTQVANSTYSRSISLPTPSKLVSALKGSREKLGASARKLTVTWAPDVYDPPPTSVSHMPNNNPQRNRKNSKKTGKNKHKGGGKGSRGIKGKDKRQSQKHGGSSSRCFKPLENESRVACSSGSHVSPIDFDVGSPDLFCGHTYLKKSGCSNALPCC